MTVVHNTKKPAPPRPDPCDSDGIRLSMHTENAATVVTAMGEIDASNIGRLTDQLTAVLPLRRPLVVDLSKLSFFGTAGLRALISLGDECAKTGIDWAVVAGHPVLRLLRIGDQDHRLPTVGSVPEALQRLARPTPARRLLQLVTKSGQGPRQ